MTWNTTALLIDAATQSQVLAALPGRYQITREELDFRSATAAALAPDVAIAQTHRRDGPNTVELWDPTGRIAMDESIVERLSVGRRVLVVYGSAMSARYGFRLLHDGALVRTSDWGSGSILNESGEPLPEENEITARPWGHDDASLLCLAELLGFRAPGDRDRRYARVRCVGAADLAGTSSLPVSFRSSMSQKARRNGPASRPRRPT